jgi:outer membrane immunogenic protein
LGYNWQFGQTVFGLEADVDAQHWRASRTAIGPGLPGIFVTGDSFTATSDWQAAFKGRLGYAFDQNLLYVTGGLALTDIAVGTNFVATTVGRINFPASSATDTKTLAGATVGAGWERALTRNWSIGLESRYSWYGTHTYNGGQVAAIGNANAAFVNVPTTQTLRLDTVEALVRINYHF